MHEFLSAPVTRTTILYLNAFASLASAGWAVAALVRPSSLSGSSHIERGEVFYAGMYAARSIPIGLTTAILPFWQRGDAVALVLFMASAIQFADVAIAVSRRDWRMMTGAFVGAIAHVLCGMVFV